MAANHQISDKKQDAVIQFFIAHPESFGKKWVDSFDRSKDKYDWLKKNWSTLEEDEDWIERFNSLSDFTKSKKQQLESTYEEYPHLGNLSKYRIDHILAKNDFTEDEMRDYYEYRAAKDAAEAEKDQKKIQEATDRYMQLQRSKDGSYFNSPTANEYARKAYIEGTPDPSILGIKLPAPQTQEVLGKTASVLDWLPYLSLISPALRRGQRVIAGELEEGLSGFHPIDEWKTTGVDYAAAIVPDIIERPGKLAISALKSKVRGLEGWPLLKKIEKRFDAGSGQAKQAQESAARDRSNTRVDLDKLSDADLEQLLKVTTDPTMKSDLEKYWQTRRNYVQTQMAREGAVETQLKQEAMGTETPEFRQFVDDMNAKLEDARFDMEKAGLDYNAHALNKTGELRMKSGEPGVQVFNADGSYNESLGNVPLKDVSNYIESQDVGGKGTALAAHALSAIGRKGSNSLIGGRFGKWDTFDPEAEVKKYNPQKDIDLVIKTDSKNWKIDEKPIDYYENPLVKAAYDQWVDDPNKTWEFRGWRREDK